MTRSQRCFLLFLLIGQFAFSQADSLKNEPIDSLLIWLDDNILPNPDYYHEIALHTLDKAHQRKDDFLIAEAHARLASWHGYHMPFSLDSVLYHSERTVQYYAETEAVEELAGSYLTLSIDYINNSQTQKAQEAIFKAIDIYEELEDEGGLGRAYRRLAALFSTENQLDLAEQYGNKALELLRKEEEYYSISLVYLEFIHVYRLLERYDESFEAADSCIVIVERAVPNGQFILARAYAEKGKTAEKVEDFEEALQFHTEAFERVAAEVGLVHPGTQSFREGIGRSLYNQGKYREALPHLQAGVKAYESREQDWVPEMANSYMLLAECYEKLENYQQAVSYQKLSRAVHDTITKNKIANLESEALIKYETGKKDQQLAEQAQQIQQKTKIQWLSIGIAVSLALLLSALFYFFKRNQKTTAALAVKNSENELLLKEIHHRVKNNLEMVSSLLKLQSVKTKDKEAKDVMRASQNRVQSMGILHQKLYQGENLGSIEMLDYFKNLSENIVDAFGANDKVEVQYDMERVELDVDTAVPIGLIVNELLTNSLKYAFPEDRKGKIELSLKEMDEKQLQLVVADNGVGQTAGASPKGTGFGSQLVQLLTSQLQGSMQADYSTGTRLVFQLEKAHWA